jgi:predicted GTPase
MRKDARNIKIKLPKEAVNKISKSMLQMENVLKAIQEEYANLTVTDIFPVSDLSTQLSMLAKVILPQTKIFDNLSKRIEESMLKDILQKQTGHLAKDYLNR